MNSHTFEYSFELLREFLNSTVDRVADRRSRHADNLADFAIAEPAGAKEETFLLE